MANHTVPSIDHRIITEGDVPEGAIAIERVVTSSVPDYGVETITMYSSQTTPDDWNGIYATVTLHADGSHCHRDDCGCVDKGDETTIPAGQPTSVGEWVWSVHQSGVVVGWHRTGPSEIEQRLQGRIEHLEEDLAKLGGRAERLRASLRGLRADHRHLDRLTTRLACVAVTGWTVAIVLALFLITVVSW